MTRQQIAANIDDYRAFAARCTTALEAAKTTGRPAAELASMREARADAIKAAADLQRLLDTVDDYEARVAALEAEGLTRSDAQGVVDAELMQLESA